jgi:hypothetical protein
MPLNAAGEIRYKNAPGKEQIQYQIDPPVCNRCKQEITQENVGWMSFESRERTGGEFEYIACREHTMMRASGPALRLFLERHHLLRER